MKKALFDSDVAAVLAAVVGTITLMLICIPISALVTMLCWNYLAPTLGMNEISWLQAMVLQLLCTMLFKHGDVSVKEKK